jgi:hypothetical protein
MVLGALVPYWIVRFDLRRLRGEWRARAWTDATMVSAPLAFGPFSLIVYFIKTRRSFGGVVLGLLSTFGVLFALNLLIWLVQNRPPLE